MIESTVGNPGSSRSHLFAGCRLPLPNSAGGGHRFCLMRDWNAAGAMVANAVFRNPGSAIRYPSCPVSSLWQDIWRNRASHTGCFCRFATVVRTY